MVKVSIVKSFKPDVKRTLDLIGYTPKKCELLAIKPNLCCPLPYFTGATTDTRILDQTIEIFKEHAEEIVVVEGDGYMAKAEESFEKSGMNAVCEAHDVAFVNLSKDILIPIKGNFKSLNDFKVPRTILKADLLLNLPVMKTHSLTTVTLSMKNLFGIIPGRKSLYHPKLTDTIADVMKIRRPDLTIMDGIVGMEGNGPVDGRSKRMNLVLASEDALAMDLVCCKIMRVNPVQVEHLQRACYYGLGECNWSNIEVVGERIENVWKRFLLS
ncbi:MAG: DUF362 domain-containing protein [Candidatus Hydrothermarchaeales archaeon]